MKRINHPASYGLGTRVLFLKGRNKDDVDVQRTVTRITHNPADFADALDELESYSIAGERIYASAGARDMKKAAHLFKQRQLAADYGADPLFYDKLPDRWTSCLMKPTSQSSVKYWMFDCNSHNDDHLLRRAFDESKRNYYRYASKSGSHIVLPAFDVREIPPTMIPLLHKNALMLWGY